MSIPKDNTARLALFALDMLTIESRAAAEVATWHVAKYVSESADNSAATVAPKRSR